MKFTKLVIMLITSLLVSITHADLTGVPKKISLVQTQTVGEGVYVWAENNSSWFDANSPCSAKNTIVVLAPNSNSESDKRAFDEVYAQVLLAQATGNKVRFGMLSGACDPASDFYYATYMQVYID